VEKNFLKKGKDFPKKDEILPRFWTLFKKNFNLKSTNYLGTLLVLTHFKRPQEMGQELLNNHNG